MIFGEQITLYRVDGSEVKAREFRLPSRQLCEGLITDDMRKIFLPS